MSLADPPDLKDIYGKPKMCPWCGCSFLHPWKEGFECEACGGRFQDLNEVIK